MLIKLKVSELKLLAARVEAPNSFESLVPRYSVDNEYKEFDHGELSPVEMATLTTYSEEQRAANPKAVNGLAQKLAIIKSVVNAPNTVKIKRLDTLEEAIKQYMRVDIINGWLFKAGDDGILYPFLVDSIIYQPRTKESEASVSITLRFSKRGKVEISRIHLNSDDIVGGVTVPDVLFKHGYVKENIELVQAYEATIYKFAEYRKDTGNQFSGIAGSGQVISERYWSSTSKKPLIRDGASSKLVNDEDLSTSVISNDRIFISYLYPERKKQDDEEVNQEQLKPVPVFPLIKFFHLEDDVQMLVHVDNVKPYEYNTSLGEKIILPKEHRKLIDILVNDTGAHMGDIIEGKTEGTIILAKGAPGTGKTLTAEVYSEVIQRPLYKVKSSQLGIDISKLEDNLKTILSRASRWGAVLLLDEADVYIRERGDSIHQNAVVGVFLRVLEYYRGLLILTTNRSTIIDDAIISRCVAIINYSIPGMSDALRIWEVLLSEFKVGGVGAKTLAPEFPNISGRTIKNLIKLTAKYSEEPTLDDYHHCVKFLPNIGV